MKVLALETSGDPASIALLDGERVMSEDSFAARLTLCEQLAARIVGLLGTATVAQAGLDAIAVSLGPGSFTSLRIGVATAKALAHCLGLPIVGIPTALALAHEAVAEGVNAAGTQVWVLQPARGATQSRPAEVYLSRFEIQPDGRPSLVSEPEVVPLDKARQAADISGACTVEGRLPCAGTIAQMAAAQSERGLEGAAGSALTLRPIYLSRSQAEVASGIDLGLDGGSM